jgi:hypothetical protein
MLVLSASSFFLHSHPFSILILSSA